MQKFTMALFMMTMLAITSFAQSIGNKSTAPLTEQEVPVSIRAALQQQFSIDPKDGAWTVYYTTVREGVRTSAKPIWYTFSKTGDIKVEIRYLPNGKLKSVKGIEKPGRTEGNAA